MSKKLSRLLDESIRLEQNVAKLYVIFHERFPMHADFWWQLVLEEESHAALIRSVKEHFEPAGKLPSDLLTSNMEVLIDSNAQISMLIERYTHLPPTMEEAFNVALEIEQSAVEAHFQEFMDTEKGSALDRMFQKLNRDDKDHALRLTTYMKEHGIPMTRC